MRVLVTGGAGFVGSAVIRRFLDHTSHAVVNVDCLTYASNPESLKSVAGSGRYDFERVNIRDRAELDRVFREYAPDGVMHLAAESHVDRSVDGPAVFMETNILGTYQLLQSARAYWTGLSGDRRRRFRVHHVSTDEVYGDLGPGTRTVDESAPYAPSSPYAASKAAGDHLVRAWQRTYGLPVILTNSSNNYGPFQFPEKLVPHMILSALQGRRLPVYGDGSQVRDWLHVEDHARALVRVFLDGHVGETYHVGSHEPRRNLDVVTAICGLLDELAPDRRVDGLDRYADLIEFVADRPGHDARYALDARKIRRELGWEAEVEFETGLRETVRWYLDNEDWWLRILSGDYALVRLGL